MINSLLFKMKTNKVFFIIPILLLNLFFISCKHRPGAPSSSEEVKDRIPPGYNEEILKKTGDFTQAHLTRDTAFLNACFTRDARILPPNALVVEGIDSISKLNADWVNYGIHDFIEKSSRMYEAGEYIIDEGNYMLRYGPNNVSDEGKYINIWKKEKGIWKIYANMWNTSLPVVDLEE